jgi:hypothetical protein
MRIPSRSCGSLPLADLGVRIKRLPRGGGKGSWSTGLELGGHGEEQQVFSDWLYIMQ